MKKDEGFIGWLILIIIALALLKYFFDWSIFDLAASEKGKETVSYIQKILDTVWPYVRVPIMFIWQKVFELFSSR